MKAATISGTPEPHVHFGSIGGSVMGKFSFRKGSGGIHNIVERSPEHVAERKRLSALLREAKRKLKNERMDHGKKDR
jgi:hypothetical protein